MSVVFADGVTIDEGKTAVEAVLDDFGGAQILSQEDLLGQIDTVLDFVLVMIFVLLFMSIGIALIGVVLILSLSVFERTREIGLIRAIGMERSQVGWTVLWEASLVSVFGALLGVGSGLALGWFGSWAVFGEGFTFGVPWQLIFVPPVAALLGALAALWPAYRGAYLNILDAIAYE